MQTRTAGRKASSLPKVVAGIAGLFFVAAGIGAFGAPEAFFEAAAVFEPYNEHFIRDIGAFQLGLGAVLLLAVWIDDGLVVALGGVGLGSLMHGAGHAIDRHLGGTPAIDIPFWVALSALLLAAAVLRWRHSSQPPPP